MGQLTEKHPEPLRDLIKRAGADGQKAAPVRAALLAGTFRGWDGTYDMPLGTVRYYLREGRKDKQRQSVSTKAQDGLRPGIDRLALEIYTELDDELRMVRNRKTRDLEKIAVLIDMLTKLAKLAPEAKPEEPAPKGRKQQKPADPVDDFTAKLRKAAGQ